MLKHRRTNNVKIFIIPIAMYLILFVFIKVLLVM